MKKLLAITGASGKRSGGAFVDVLCEHHEEIYKNFPGGVRAILRASSNAEGLGNAVLPFEIVKGDFASKEFLSAALEGVDTLVHIAGIRLSPMLVEAAASCRVRRVIVVHTTGIYSKFKEAGVEYRKIDAEITRACSEAGILLTILRPTMIYGNISDGNIITFIKMVDRFPLMPVVNGAHYALQPVHYMDLALAYYNVLMNENATSGKNFDLSGGEALDLRDMLLEIGKQLGKRTKFINCPFPIAYAGAWFIYLISFGRGDYREKVQRLCEPRVYSHEEATKAFGYLPRTFAAGVAEEIREYVSHKEH